MTGSSARRRVLLSRDTLMGLCVVVLAAALCVALGLWQYGRFEDRRDAAAVVESNYTAQPVTIDEALPAPDEPLPAEQEWTPVRLHGTYCTSEDCVLYARNRTLSGSVGFWQLVPFRADDGTDLLIARGWVNTAEQDSVPDDPPPVPEGEITVTVRLRPVEPVLDRELPAGQVHSVNPAQIATVLPPGHEDLVTGAFGELSAEDPDGPRPHPLESPDTSLGPHLSYAFQWWIFAVFFPAALIFRTRKVIQETQEDEEERTAAPTRPVNGADESEPSAGIEETVDAAPSEAAPAPPPRRKRATGTPRRAVRVRRRSQDEEEEDALIDQHPGSQPYE